MRVEGSGDESRSLWEGAQVEAGELVWGSKMSGVVKELKGTVDGRGDVVEGGKEGGWHSAQRALDFAVNIHGSTCTALLNCATLIRKVTGVAS
jgi:hypothetical protein